MTANTGKREARRLACNRIVKGKHERFCYRCEKWLALKEFPFTNGCRVYRCRECGKEAGRARWRAEAAGMAVKPKHHLNLGLPRETHERKPFSDGCVAIKAMDKFLRMPTPENLKQRRAA